MSTWQTAIAEMGLTYSPVGLRLVDEFTNEEPLGKTSAYLDIREANGVWHPTDIPATKTPSNVVAYPGLGRTSDVTVVTSRHYRVRITAELYVPLYQATVDGIEFDAPAFNEGNPLPKAKITFLPQDLYLMPATNYPFQGHVPVLWGIVKDAAGKPVQNVMVTQGGGIERVVTDSRGAFGLPLRWAAQNVPIHIDATDNRTNRIGHILVTLPGDLASSHTIQIN